MAAEDGERKMDTSNSDSDGITCLGNVNKNTSNTSSKAGSSADDNWPKKLIGESEDMEIGERPPDGYDLDMDENDSKIKRIENCKVRGMVLDIWIRLATGGKPLTDYEKKVWARYRRLKHIFDLAMARSGTKN